MPNPRAGWQVKLRQNFTPDDGIPTMATGGQEPDTSTAAIRSNEERGQAIRSTRLTMSTRKEVDVPYTHQGLLYTSSTRIHGELHDLVQFELEDGRMPSGSLRRSEVLGELGDMIVAKEFHRVSSLHRVTSDGWGVRSDAQNQGMFMEVDDVPTRLVCSSSIAAGTPLGCGGEGKEFWMSANVHIPFDGTEDALYIPALLNASTPLLGDPLHTQNQHGRALLARARKTKGVWIWLQEDMDVRVTWWWRT
ncbi:uncharacterized protein LAESUDRAFT_712963 [Laetiporus sulphureus 93-53]|uniref:Uncharacterized protein n=1 Tax=Laetiporus sulphureus 93-53 TaxID=1314785 RepID=A0A165F627_9APHY|nr:uncharacterized protein LAESUDRAFT_712963 [Laetiporus sulphureus 93-53]KZT08465.1 hypothetical protein LAESUDRAFT_712963 [Laetiporus sulphureus 93-53]